ncbi:MAG: ribonuclease HII [Promicromonosporaceae bacterium]|nr:ribonuclease HII [Promicromonosporaceae bacterium]
MSGKPTPTLKAERDLIAADAVLVAGMDEVGRGALAGPVCVGVVVIGATTGEAPVGTADSKLLTAKAREVLAPRLRDWPVAWAVGYAQPGEIDELGIIAALRLAGQRALQQAAHTCARPIDVVILDGAHDWLSRPEQGDLFDIEAPSAPRVRLMVKADQTCSSVAAASVLAKVARDALLTELSEQHPEFGWDSNKGYASAKHIAALRCLGPTEHHRRSWNLPLTQQYRRRSVTTS